MGAGAVVTVYRHHGEVSAYRLDSVLGRQVATKEWGEHLITFGAPGKPRITIRPHPRLH
jgi:hypothetical protein